VVARARFEWIVSPIAGMGPHVTKAMVSLYPAVLAALEAAGAITRAEAQANHPWNNITGDAERGLSVDVSGDGAVASLTLYHTVYYGVYLELRWGGRYAVIMPTLQAQYGPIMDAVRAALATIW
jgi:hypothetical protein